MTQMRAAIGGDAWNGIAETDASGYVTISGLRGNARIANELHDGRYAQRFDVAGMGSTAEVYDGSTVWAQDISGGVHPYDTPFARARAITSAYLIRHAYFDAGTGATFACLGTRSEGGKSVIVIRVRPRGGIPADLAVDAQTHLLASVTEQLPLDSADGVIRFADYRSLDGVVLPFSISRGTEKEPADGYAVNVTRYAVRPRADDLNYVKPSVPDTCEDDRPCEVLDGADAARRPPVDRLCID